MSKGMMVTSCTCGTDVECFVHGTPVVERKYGLIGGNGMAGWPPGLYTHIVQLPTDAEIKEHGVYRAHKTIAVFWDYDTAYTFLCAVEPNYPRFTTLPEDLMKAQGIK